MNQFVLLGTVFSGAMTIGVVNDTIKLKLFRGLNMIGRRPSLGQQWVLKILAGILIIKLQIRIE